ncbi:MAG: DUF1801 domain-containing protein [Rhodothermales bacterium]|nr:DUF1801 domain-containing protein [Rhodothermales bacterium]
MPKNDSSGFTADERAAMRERTRELKASAKREDGERDVLEKIAEMPDADREMAERLHALIANAAPGLAPRTWYGMPAYALDGKTVCFFQSAGKFKTRYATLGFSDEARLDDGDFWPTSFALVAWTTDVEKAVRRLVLKAVG